LDARVFPAREIAHLLKTSSPRNRNDPSRFAVAWYRNVETCVERFQNGPRIVRPHGPLLIISNVDVGTEFVAAGIRLDFIGQYLQ
jgi:hypothetical protein